MTEKHFAIDLFCGAGGLSLGLEAAGFDIQYAIDSDGSVQKTYDQNHNVEMECRPVEDVDPSQIHNEIGDVDLVAGGPPCPTFSQIGRSKIQSLDDQDPTVDHRHQLYEHFLRFVEEFDPTVFLMENVEGMTTATTADGRNVVDHISEEMESLGYCVNAQVVDAADYGVPQRRKRLFFVGTRSEQSNPDLDNWRSHRPPRRESEKQIAFLREPDAFAPSNQTTISTFSADVEERDGWFRKNPSHRNPWVTVGEAILDLPPVSPDGSHPPAKATHHVLPPLTDYQKWAREHEGYDEVDDDPLYNHRGRYHNLLDLAVYRLLGPGTGWSLAEVEGDLDELHPYRDDVFADKYKKQNPTEPATTIIAHLQKDGHMFVHPREARSLTVREAARLQSFPDSFRFHAPMTQSFKHVGNAVPPLLAQAIGEAISETVLEEPSNQ